MPRPLIWLVIAVALLLLPNSTLAQSTSLPKGKGAILLRVVDPDGNSLPSSPNVQPLHFNVFQANRSGDNIIKIGTGIYCPETGDQGALIPGRPFCVPPGNYLLVDPYWNVRYYAGEPLPKDQLYFEVKEGQTAQRSITLGQIQVTIRFHDGKVVPNLYFALNKVLIDANGVAKPGNRFPDTQLNTGETGKGLLNVTPGKYLLAPVNNGLGNVDTTFFFTDKVGVQDIKAGQKMVIDLTLDRVDYVPRNPDGSLQKKGDLVLYQPKVNANGEFLPPKWREGLNHNVGATGAASFNLLPGTYSLSYWEDTQTQKLIHNIVVSPSVRVLLSNLADWDTPTGHYFTQTGANQGGYLVTNEAGLNFWDEFNRLGGLATFVYRVSNKFFYQGTFVLVFQNATLAWDPLSGQAQFWPVLENLANLKGEEWLLAKQVPTLVMFDDENEALSLLESYPYILNSYFDNPNWREQYGLPSSVVETDSFVLLRTTNAIFQWWLQDLPGVAKAGEVTLINTGDWVKEAGVVPKDAATPVAPN